MPRMEELLSKELRDTLMSVARHDTLAKIAKVHEAKIPLTDLPTRSEAAKREAIKQVLIRYAARKVSPDDLADEIKSALTVLLIQEARALQRLSDAIDDEHSHGGHPTLDSGC